MCGGGEEGGWNGCLPSEGTQLLLWVSAVSSAHTVPPLPSIPPSQLVTRLGLNFVHSPSPSHTLPPHFTPPPSPPSQLVSRLGFKLVRYAVLLVVPLLRRMSDACEGVRRHATTCFGALVALLPLAQGMASPPGLDSEQLEGVARDSVFLMQLLDSKQAEDFALPEQVGGRGGGRWEGGGHQGGRRGTAGEGRREEGGRQGLRKGKAQVEAKGGGPTHSGQNQIPTLSVATTP